MMSGLNCRPSACYAEVVTVTLQHFGISPLSSNFISNVGLTRNKVLDLSFNQVKELHFVKNLPRCCPGLNWRPSACKADVIATTPQTLRLVLPAVISYQIFGLTRGKIHALNFNRAETSFCCNLFLMLSRLELETFCVLNRRDHRCTAAPWD